MVHHATFWWLCQSTVWNIVSSLGYSSKTVPTFSSHWISPSSRVWKPGLISFIFNVIKFSTPSIISIIPFIFTTKSLNDNIILTSLLITVINLFPYSYTSFFRLKSKIQQWHQDPLHIGTSLTKYTVVPLLRMATEEILQEKPNLISNGFRRGGLCPWNPEAIDKSKMLPATVFARYKSILESYFWYPHIGPCLMTYKCQTLQWFSQWWGEGWCGGTHWSWYGTECTQIWHCLT